MTYAKKFIGIIDVHIQEMLERKQVLSDDLSKYDKEVNKLYHDIENSRFNACQGYKYSRRLQQLLRERRKVKFEMLNIDEVYKSLKVQSIKDRIKNIDTSLKSIEERYFKDNPHYKEYINT